MKVNNDYRDNYCEIFQLPPSRLFPDVLHVAFHDHQRIAVVSNDAGRQILVPQREHLFARRSVVRSWLMIANRQRMTQFSGHGKTPGQCLVWLKANHDLTLTGWKLLHPNWARQ